jgi:AraC-like DNA-binding protein
VSTQHGFEFLGYLIKRGKTQLNLPESKIRSQVRQGMLYAYPKEKSIRRFKEKVRQRTKRTTALKTKELIAGLNPLLRGWGEYYKRAHVQSVLGKSPLSYFQSLRVERAVHLLKTSHASADEVASRVGYADAATLRTLLRNRLKLGVKQIRRTL